MLVAYTRRVDEPRPHLHQCQTAYACNGGEHNQLDCGRSAVTLVQSEYPMNHFLSNSDENRGNRKINDEQLKPPIARGAQRIQLRLRDTGGRVSTRNSLQCLTFTSRLSSLPSGKARWWASNR